MAAVVVADSSCLIGLGRIRRLDLLRGLFEHVLVPVAVRNEIGVIPDWLEVCHAPDELLTGLALERLGRGESEAIALALARTCPVILDELRGRKIAKRRGLVVLGTGRILLKGKEAGLLPAIGPVLQELVDHDFHLSEGLCRTLLHAAGELP